MSRSGNPLSENRTQTYVAQRAVPLNQPVILRNSLLFALRPATLPDENAWNVHHSLLSFNSLRVQGSIRQTTRDFERNWTAAQTCFPPNLLSGGRYAAITFDDAFEDAVENAVPELVQRKIPAIFFVTPGFLGQAAAWWPAGQSERNRRIASAEQLRRLPPDLIEFGAHSVTHPRLSELDESDARREIVESRRSLKALLGREVDTFSFPYGDFNEQLVGFCREAGYKRVFTSESKEAFGNAADFVVGRVDAEPTDWEIEFRVKLLGDTCGGLGLLQ